jgi:hypothetical protein
MRQLLVVWKSQQVGQVQVAVQYRSTWQLVDRERRYLSQIAQQLMSNGELDPKLLYNLGVAISEQIPKQANGAPSTSGSNADDLHLVERAVKACTVAVISMCTVAAHSQGQPLQLPSHPMLDDAHDNLAVMIHTLQKKIADAALTGSVGSDPTASNKHRSNLSNRKERFECSKASMYKAVVDACPG